jgi:hypothetical protein
VVIGLTGLVPASDTPQKEPADVAVDLPWFWSTVWGSLVTRIQEFVPNFLIPQNKKYIRDAVEVAVCDSGRDIAVLKI